MSENYEFSAEQNRVLSALHRSLSYFALANVALGLATLALAYILAVQEDELFAGIIVLALGVLYCALGFVWRRPLDNIKNIVHTSDQDVDELMVATEDFRKAFMVSAVIFAGFLLLRLLLSFGDMFFDTDLGQ